MYVYIYIYIQLRMRVHVHTRMHMHMRLPKGTLDVWAQTWGLNTAGPDTLVGEHKKVYESSGCMGQSSFKVNFQKYVMI